MRDMVDDQIERVRIDSRESYQRVQQFCKQFMPELESRVEYYPGERPILSGGRKIESWATNRKGWWEATLPDVATGDWYFSQLFVNDQRRFRPRLPGKGYYTIAEQIPATRRNVRKGHDRFRYGGEDLNPEWENLEDVEVFAFHIWSASRMRIASLDTKEKVVTFTSATRSTSHWGAFRKGHRFLAINVKEALQKPGQWYLDRKTGLLTYIPRPGEKPKDAKVIAPCLSRLVIFSGDIPGRKWTQHIHLRGLTFAHANWALPPEGMSFPQGEVNIGGAVTAVGARHCLIDECAVRHVGGYAMDFEVGCQHNRIEGCELWDMGAGGVKMGHSGGKGRQRQRDSDGDPRTQPQRR